MYGGELNRKQATAARLQVQYESVFAGRKKMAGRELPKRGG